MTITVKLYASLGQYLPEPTQQNTTSLDIKQAASISDVLRHYHVPLHETHIALINGVYVAKQDYEHAVLKTGDTVSIWPPVAGG